MISFKKMHGNGNDFVIINALTQNISLTKNKIKKLGCRKKGIGFDQLILICPPSKKDCDFLIKFFNSDGSSAKMCLNGIRCAASFVWDESLTPHKSINLQTVSRNIVCKKNRGKVEALISMPTSYEDRELERKLLAILGNEKFFLKDCGNKHLCIKKLSIKKFDLHSLYDELEPLMSNNHINLSIYKKIQNDIQMRTYENGVGETLSCGSASASIASIVLNEGQKIKVSSNGGDLHFNLFKDKLKMIGPTKVVYSGIINND